VIFGICSTGHENITKVDQASQCYIGKKNGLFQSDGMRTPGLLFKNGPRPDMGSGPAAGSLQENSPGKETALQRYVRAYITVLNCHRCFITDVGTLQNKR